MTTLNQAFQEAEQATKRELRIMDPREGDLRMTWDPKSASETDMARDAFDAAKKKGLVGYRVKRGGGKGEVMHSFDPDAEAVIMAPRLRGG